MSFVKEHRGRIRMKFGGHCAYCGVEIGEVFHVDHVEPLYRGWRDKPANAGDDDIANLFPSCARCNLRKNVLTVEEFRHEISMQVSRVRSKSSGFRLAEDFGLIQETGEQVRFYFEATP
ncbi:MAG: HNH endonuclease [Candidatus Paceibacterota bacterium]|jgi:predicted restriction endonuclease